MKRLVVIDGKSVFYRGYYAMGALSLSDGTPTGGVYGFASIAMELVKDLAPDKVVVAWDKAKTSTSKRKAIFADYKAGRVKPGDDFFAQIPLLKELIDGLGWGFFECDDYEADDIIGTLAAQSDESGYEVCIISSDLDMLQVVDENVKMYRLIKGFTDLEEIDIPGVEAKYGIEKRQFLDLKSLKGDSSDNIPGVPGIGEKGAVKLLNEYGSLENIYNHIDEIKGATQRKLIEGKDSAFMSYQLAKIMTDAPIKIADIPDFVPYSEKTLDILRKLEFHSLVRKFRNMLGDNTEPSERGEEPGIEIEIPKDLIIEWDIKGKMHKDPAFAEKILGGADFWDLGQGKFLLNPLERKSSDEQKQGVLDFGETDEDIKKKELEYSRQANEFNKNSKLKNILLNFDFPMIPVLFKMERNGLKISKDYFTKLKSEYEEHVHSLEQKIYQSAGVEFNVNSPLQLSEILFEKLQLPNKGIKKTSRGYSTGVKELLKLQNEHEIIPLIMEYREAAKLLNTYITPLPELADSNDVIHSTFTQDVTATGRLSSLSPNLQNIPVRSEEGKRIRKGFVARDGYTYISADYSQFELRLAAVLSGDEQLTNDFNSGVDIHTKTAADVFNLPLDEVTKTQRRAAKVINFGVLYGMSAKGLSDATGLSVGEAKQFITDYFEVRKPVKTYLDNILTLARNVGYVETFYGRRRPTPDVKSSNFIVRQGAERAAQNMPIQGTEADLVKRAMIELDQKLPNDVNMVLQIHDSIMVECPDEKVGEISELLKLTMENVAPELKIKLAVDVVTGKDWGEL